jgi:hypothetical protein
MDQPKSKDGAMREAMPGVTAFIDSMRGAFGAEVVDQGIRQGLANGEFWAVEGKAPGPAGGVDWAAPDLQVVGFPFCRYPRPVAAEGSGPVRASRPPEPNARPVTPRKSRAKK